MVNWVGTSEVNESLSTTVADLKRDLSEVDYLMADVQPASTSGRRMDNAAAPASETDLEGKFEPAFLELLTQLKFLRMEAIDTLDAMTVSCRSNTCLDVVGSGSEQARKLAAKTREKLLSLKALLRVAYRQKAALNMLDPNYASNAIHAYERTFLSQYASHLGSAKLRCYLHNSGMAAFATILHFVERLQGREQSADSVVGLQPMYFENMQMLERIFPGMLVPSPTNPDELYEYLDAKLPRQIYLDAASNHGVMLVHELESVISWSERDTNSDVILVVDSTCFSLSLLPAGLLARVPSNVTIVFVESLAKHHQFGLDMVTGGVALVHGSEKAHDCFERSRQDVGSAISESNVGILPSPNRIQLTSRLERHSRNIAFFADQLEKRVAVSDSILKTVSWVKDGLARPDFHTSNMAISFQERFRAKEKYSQFQSKLIEVAEKNGLALALGTSFGFDVTRVFLTTPGTTSPEPYLRVSIGTETRTDLEILLATLAQVDRDLLDEWTN
ncbi:MAG TPA: PLP-dependent transferase [Oculatellaceae cyanobacterium]